MDHFSARDAMRPGAHSRRWRMRERARSQHAAPPAPDSAPARLPGRYQTPEWLDRSFVLPLTRPEATDGPSQPFRRHDDDPAPRSQMTPEVPRQPAPPGTAGAMPPPRPDATARGAAGVTPGA